MNAKDMRCNERVPGGGSVMKQFDRRYEEEQKAGRDKRPFTQEGETLRKIVRLILVGLTGAGRGRCCGGSSRDSNMHISLKVETTG